MQLANWQNRHISSWSRCHHCSLTNALDFRGPGWALERTKAQALGRIENEDQFKERVQCSVTVEVFTRCFHVCLPGSILGQERHWLTPAARMHRARLSLDSMVVCQKRARCLPRKHFWASFEHLQRTRAFLWVVCAVGTRSHQLFKRPRRALAAQIGSLELGRRLNGFWNTARSLLHFAITLLHTYGEVKTH